MAMSLSLSPASDALPAPTAQGGVDSNNSSSNLSVSNNNISSNTTGTLMNDHPGQSQIAPSKRKPSRRANTAERRATHNAVERQRRETLNGRFLDLAILLPNLSQIRRPSKSSIVNSSIAHIQASRRHRHVASRELKLLKFEADALRREVNEWRDRNGLPRVDEPIRGDGFGIVLAGELEVIQGIAIEEEDEDSEDSFGAAPMGAMPGAPHQPQQQTQAFNSAYMDDVEEEVAMLGAMYAQQQSADVHLAPQRQVQLQHPMMAPQPHELEDPRMATMLLKNSSLFGQNIAQSLAGYQNANARSATYANSAANWVPSQVAGFSQFTHPSNSHPGNTSASGSPVGGVSANGSPTSTTSSLSSFSGGSPLSVVPSHHGPLGYRRERSGSLTGSSPGSQSPSYELQHATHAAMQEFAGMPRMGGMCGSSFVPSHHHALGQGLGMQGQPQSMGVAGGANTLMMMMA
jgi:hypothetical protein